MATTSQLVHPDTCFVFVTWDSILSAIGFLRKGNSLVPINWGMDLNIFQRNFTSQKQDRKCAGTGQMALSECFFNGGQGLGFRHHKAIHEENGMRKRPRHGFTSLRDKMSGHNPKWMIGKEKQTRDESTPENYK